MPDQLLNILIQLPVVAIFVWYSDRMYKQFQDFLREERIARDKQLDGLGAEIKALRTELAAASQSGHDARDRRHDQSRP